MRARLHDVKSESDDLWDVRGERSGGGDGRNSLFVGFGGGVDLEEDVEGSWVGRGDGGEGGFDEGGFLDGFQGFESEEVGDG